MTSDTRVPSTELTGIYGGMIKMSRRAARQRRGPALRGDLVTRIYPVRNPEKFSRVEREVAVSR